MADKKTGETKDELLGELESIKGLLSEGEMDNIPVLLDAVGDSKAAESKFDSNTFSNELKGVFDTLEGQLKYVNEEKKIRLIQQETVPTQSESDSMEGKPNQNMPPLQPQHNSVLPGQQSLFEDQPQTEPNIALNEEQRSAQEPALNSLDTVAETQAEAPQIKPENPFLPKHIRSRLHTKKKLIDEIKETVESESARDAEAKALESDKTDTSLRETQIRELVDQVIASNLPKIEEELRHHLLELFSTRIPNQGITDNNNDES